MTVERDAFIKGIFSVVAPHIDFLSTFFSFGFCHLWRRKLVSLSEMRGNERVLDLCTGTGNMALLLGKRIRKGSIIGIDFCEEMIRIARRKIKPEQKNISFVVSDAKMLEFPDETFDVVTVAFGMRNITDMVSALCEVRRVLKPNGKFLCLELTKPEKKCFLPIYKFYLFRVIPLLGRIVTGSDIPYKYLPRSIDAFYTPREFNRIIEEIGFRVILTVSMTMGVATIFVAEKR